MWAQLKTFEPVLEPFWQAWREGRGHEGAPGLAVVHRVAAEEGRATLVVQAMALRALCLLEAGDFAGATRCARRGSRMARTEEQEMVLANLVLARCRRWVGRGALAARILAALPAPTTATLAPWWRWERFLTGLEPEAPHLHGHDDLAHFARRLLTCTSIAEFDVCAQALCAPSGHVGPIEQEAQLLLAALDVRIDPEVFAASTTPAVPQDSAEALVRWANGHAAALPAPLQSLARPLHDDDGFVVVVAAPDRKPRRVLAHGMVLVRALGLAPSERRAHRQDRLDTAAAALALAGPQGLEEATFFASVYGFSFVPALHDGTFRALIHRLRSHLGADASVHRSLGRIHMQLHRAVVLPDPRSAPNAGDDILSLLARTRTPVTAAEAAARLNLSVRTVQAVLRELLADGVCQQQREGRHVRYVVEDSTFTEPTDWQRIG